jgi:hypothetical protein
MEKFKKGDYIVVRTNQSDVHASWVVNSSLTSEDLEPSEYIAKVKSVIDNGAAYLVYISSIGFRCVVDVSEILRRVSEDELTDDERDSEDSEEFTAPNVYINKVEDDEASDEDKCMFIAEDAMNALFPKEFVVTIDLCFSPYLKSDLLTDIDNLIKRIIVDSEGEGFYEKRDYFKEMLENLRFKEYYKLRVGIEDELDEAIINYVYLTVDTHFEEASIMWDFHADTQKFIRSLGPEYDSIRNYYIDLRTEIMRSPTFF